MSFSGTAVFATDGTTLGTPVAFADQRIVFNKNENNSLPDLIDGQSYAVNRVVGLKVGQIQVSGVVQMDRAFDTFLTSAFGPRTGGQLTPWVMSLVPYSGAAAVNAAGIWWNSIRIFSAFSVGGGAQMVAFQLNGMCLDPDNSLGSTALAVPGYVGTSGTGIAPFARAAFNNDGATSYDLVRAFDFALSNRLQIQPAVKSVTNRIAAGCTPSMITGALSLTQLTGATNPLPRTFGTYPIDLVLKSGDGTKTLTLATSMSYDGVSQSYSPTDFAAAAVNYSLYSTSTGATATAGYPFTAVIV
jgi:hypothetical protein